MCFLIFFIFIEGEDVVDVVDEGLDGDGCEGGGPAAGEVLEVLFLQELFVVDEEAVELGEVLLLCHLIFIIVSGSG